MRSTLKWGKPARPISRIARSCRREVEAAVDLAQLLLDERLHAKADAPEAQLAQRVDLLLVQRLGAGTRCSPASGRGRRRGSSRARRPGGAAPRGQERRRAAADVEAGEAQRPAASA